VSWRRFQLRLGKPPRVVIKRAEYDAWTKRRQRRQALMGAGMILLLAAVSAALTWEFTDWLLRGGR